MSTTIKVASREKKTNTVISKTKTRAVRKKSSDKKATTTKKQKKKNNLLKLCSVMNNYADDANDKEIVKRFKTTIISSIDEDISKTSLNLLLKNSKDVNIADFSETIQPYLKHYFFMLNRQKSKKK